MQGTRMVKAIYSWKPISRRPIRRPNTRCVDDVRKDIQKLKVPNWKTLAQELRCPNIFVHGTIFNLVNIDGTRKFFVP